MYVINFFGGPGCGKSTLSTALFTLLKTKYNLRVEYVHEYAKDLVYEDRKNILKNDQLYVFAKQNHMLKMIELSDQIDVVINDSPILLSSIFGNLNNVITKKFDEFIIETFKSYNNINFLIHRNDNFFQTYGRIEKTVDEAKKVDELIQKILNENHINFDVIFNNKDMNHILDQICLYIKKTSNIIF